MTRILIRPEDLARLAQRFDAAADDLTRSGRRLSRARDEVRLSRADESFPAAHVAERSRMAEDGLRRLAAEFRVDGGLMARTVDDAEFDDAGRWTSGLTSGSGPGARTILPAVAGWSSVAAGLSSLETRSSPIDARPSVQGRATGVGGLFLMSSTAAAHGMEMLDRLTNRLGGSSSIGDTRGNGDDSGTGSATGAVWSRIVGELFTADDD